jgi:hypothetical protein
MPTAQPAQHISSQAQTPTIKSHVFTKIIVGGNTVSAGY